MDVLHQTSIRETLARTLAWHFHAKRLTWDQMGSFQQQKWLHMADVALHVYTVSSPQVRELPTPRELLLAMWEDLGDDTIVVMPRRLFDAALARADIEPMAEFMSPPPMDNLEISDER